MRVAKPALKWSKPLLKQSTLAAIRRSLAIDPVRRFAARHVLPALDAATAKRGGRRLRIIEYAAGKLAIELARARPNGGVETDLPERRGALAAPDTASEGSSVAPSAPSRPSTSLRGR